MAVRESAGVGMMDFDVRYDRECGAYKVTLVRDDGARIPLMRDFDSAYAAVLAVQEMCTEDKIKE